MLYLVGSSLCAATILAYTYLLQKQRRGGWWLMLITQPLMMVYDVVTNQAPYCLLGVMTMMLAYRALTRDWKKNAVA